jgi:hypothetical protein
MVEIRSKTALNALIIRRDCLDRSITGIFRRYSTGKCEYYVHGTQILNRCFHGDNKVGPLRHYKICTIQACPEREKI